jgi:hypothetical protein
LAQGLTAQTPSLAGPRFSFHGRTPAYFWTILEDYIDYIEISQSLLAGFCSMELSASAEDHLFRVARPHSRRVCFSFAPFYK